MKTTTRRTAAVMLVGLAACSNVLAYDPTVAQELALWRHEILAQGNLGGIELDSAHYRSLSAMGPACLPEVFEAFRDETDAHVLYYYAILIRRIAHFDVFRYSERPFQIGDQEFQYDGEKPFLSVEIGNAGPGARASAVAARDRLVEWWSRRASFLRRRETGDVVRATLGRGEQEFQRFDNLQSREFSKLAVYGIYNLPDYLDIVREDNDPVVFSECLRITNHPEYQALGLTGDLAANARAVTAKYPTRESKVSVLCEWWPRIGETYKRLEDLHGEIESRVQAMCPDAIPQHKERSDPQGGQDGN